MKKLFKCSILLFGMLSLSSCALPLQSTNYPAWSTKRILESYTLVDGRVVGGWMGANIKDKVSAKWYEFTVNYAEVTDITAHNNQTYTYKIGNTHNVYTDYYIGKNTKVYRKIGGIMRFLESKWGFLLLIVLPTMVAVIYEFYAIIVEVIEFKKEVYNE